MRIARPNPLIHDRIMREREKIIFSRPSDDYLDIDVELNIIYADGVNLLLYMQGFTQDVGKTLSAWHKWWHINRNEVSEIQIIVKMRYRGVTDIPFPITYFSGNCHFMASWLVVHGKDGVTFQRQGVTNLGFKSGDGEYKFGVAPEQSESPLEAEIGFVALNLKTVWVRSDSGVDVGLGIGPASAGVTLGAGEDTYFKDYPIKAMLFVTDRKAAVDLPEHLMSWTINFPHNVRDKNVDGLSDLQKSWAVPLKKDYAQLVKAIKTGAVPIKLKGYASATAKREVDDKVSLQRIIWAEDWIRVTFDDRSSKAIRFVREPKGHSEAAQKGRSDLEQRVEILVDRAAAMKALGGSQ